MARGGSRRREYVRDGNGRFASTGTTGRKAKPSPGYLRSQRTKLARQRGQTGRLGSATKAARAQLRASRAKLTPGASPQQRAAVTRAQRTVAALAGQRRIQSAPRAGVLRGPAAGKVRKASGARVRQGQTQVMEPQVMGGRTPAAQRPGSITSTLRGTLQALARADAARIREVEAITGQPVRAPRRPAAGTGATVRAPGRGSVTGTIRDGLRSLAQSDARTAREIDAILKGSPTGALKGSGSSGGKRRRVRGSEPASKALPPGPAKPITRGKAAPAGAPAAPAKKSLRRGPRVRLPRMATPAGVIRGSDLAKVKADAQKGIGTPQSRAAQRAFARSAREAPLLRRQAIAAAKRRGVTGFGSGPQMNTASIGNSAFNWNRNEQPATARERLAMWQKSERRNRGFWSGGRGVSGAAAGELRASRRAARLVDSGSRLGDLPTTRRMAEQPRQRRVDRVSRNETTGRLAYSDASRRLLPQIQKVRDAAQKRIAEGKKPTAAQLEKERKLVGEYNKQVRKLQVAQAAKAYMDNPWGFTPQRMSGSRRSAGVVEPAKPAPAPAKPTRRRR